MDGTKAEIRLFAGTFAPRNWAFCRGQLLSTTQYTALFSLLGTQYGGDGRSTFGLPDLRGRTIIGQGRGPGLSSYEIGKKGGAPFTKVELVSGEVPKASFGASEPVVTGLHPPAIDQSPCLGLNYIICLEGDYPSRS